ncbi:hypothetical protein [Zoogloea sp. LCSB751]|uniref:hypothetical protein n=1 Tax=Zoogloea sp. LCSB751 TaxID=1965277 RepID=UPI001117A3E3|nr:hypothetical protein [Zoogloea sp. LCSB751]
MSQTENLLKRVQRIVERDDTGTASLAERLRSARQEGLVLETTPVERLARLEAMKPSKLRDRLIRAYRRQLEGAQQ